MFCDQLFEDQAARAMREMCRAVVTVDWTTKMSAPASTAIGASFLVLAGVQETAQTPPPSLISRTRRPISSSLIGAAVSRWMTAAESSWRGRDDLRDRGLGVFVAALQPLEVHHREAAALAHLDGEPGVDDGVQRGGEDRVSNVMLAYAEVDIRQLRVDGDGAGNDRHFVKPVGGSEFLQSSRKLIASSPRYGTRWTRWTGQWAFQSVYQPARGGQQMYGQIANQYKHFPQIVSARALYYRRLSMGTLYLVATPIGNLEDVTLRALRVLREVALIAAEDTRTTRKLLAHYGITRPPRLSYNEHNMARAHPADPARPGEGDVALVSEAGTPGVSDPGYELVGRRARRRPRRRRRPRPVRRRRRPRRLRPARRASSPSSASCPAAPASAAAFRVACRDERRTLVAFESPHRVRASLADMLAAWATAASPSAAS